MKKILKEYHRVFTHAGIRSLCVAFLLIILALTFQFYASGYWIRNSGTFVGDIFLDNIPTLDMSIVVVEGALLAVAVTIFLLLSRPRAINFGLKAGALFIAIRAFFLAMTHLGVYPNQIVLGNGFLDEIYVSLNLQAGSFFSAHTGLPLLMALIFWKDRLWRYVFLGFSGLFGAAVLLSHVHYSIDVFAAPFMTYSIFKLAEYLFKDDYAVMTLPGGM